MKHKHYQKVKQIVIRRWLHIYILLEGRVILLMSYFTIKKL